MAVYAIGPVNGDPVLLKRLLSAINFDREQDKLWFCGDLVGAGPNAAELLRMVKELGRNAVLVLGRQELRLLAAAEGVAEPQGCDAFADFASAPDAAALLKWLCQRPFIHHEAGYTMVHAGIPAEWSLSQARTFAIEAESSLAMGNRKSFFENVAGDHPSRWHAKLRGWKRLRFIVNALTRMTVCDAGGRFDFSGEAPGGDSADQSMPWYRVPERAMAGQAVIFAYGLESNELTIPGLFPLQKIRQEAAALGALRLASTPEAITVAGQ